VLDLNDFFYFVQVVDRGGFTAASRTLRVPKSTLSHRIQQLETSLGVRLLNRTSRRFGMTDAGAEFYRHAVAMLREAEVAETAIRHRLHEPTGTVRFTAAVATLQFAMRDITSDFLVRYPKVNVVAHATDQNVDIVGENYDVAIRAHTDPLPDSTLVQRTLTPAPWFLFAGSAYLDAKEALRTPQDLQNHPSLFMMRTGVAPVWRPPADEESGAGARVAQKAQRIRRRPPSGVEGCAHRERTYLLWRITNPAPRTVCSKSCAKPLSIFDRRREMCTSMTLVCGSK
jgi:DNA-binding transcriptional LysR family regulator